MLRAGRVWVGGQDGEEGWQGVGGGQEGVGGRQGVGVEGRKG